MSLAADNTDFLALAKKAFTDSQQDVQDTRAAMKSVANTLLLQEKTRQQFADAGYAAEVADRLHVLLRLRLLETDQ